MLKLAIFLACFVKYTQCTDTFVVANITPRGVREANRFLDIILQNCKNMRRKLGNLVVGEVNTVYLPNACASVLTMYPEFQGKYSIFGQAKTSFQGRDLQTPQNLSITFELYEDVLYRIQGSRNYNCSLAIIVKKGAKTVECSFKPNHQNMGWYFKIYDKTGCVNEYACSVYSVKIYSGAYPGYSVNKKKKSLVLSSKKTDHFFTLKHSENHNSALLLLDGKKDNAKAVVVPVVDGNKHMLSQTEVEVFQLFNSTFVLAPASFHIAGLSKNISRETKIFLNNSTALVYIGPGNQSIPNTSSMRILENILKSHFLQAMLPEVAIDWNFFNKNHYEVNPFTECLYDTFTTISLSNYITISFHVIFYVSMIINNKQQAVPIRNINNMILKSIYPNSTLILENVNTFSVLFYVPKKVTFSTYLLACNEYISKPCNDDSKVITPN